MRSRRNDWLSLDQRGERCLHREKLGAAERQLPQRPRFASKLLGDFYRDEMLSLQAVHQHHYPVAASGLCFCHQTTHVGRRMHILVANLDNDVPGLDALATGSPVSIQACPSTLILDRPCDVGDEPFLGPWEWRPPSLR
jgi:hypothetical protein